MAAVERRRNYFIDKDFQTKFIIKFCALIILTSVLTGILIYLFNRGSNTVAFENLKVVVKSTSDFILPIVFQILIVVTVMVGAATVFVTLLASHKISGPLYKLSTELGKIKGKDLTSSIRIRNTDQLKNVVKEFEDMRVSYRDSLSEIRSAAENLSALLGKNIKDIKDDGSRKKIADLASKLNNELSKFKTK